MKIDLSGKVAVVTGGSGQLGRTIVRTLAHCGADVAVHYLRNTGKAEELCGELIEMGVRAVAVQADVTTLDSVLLMKDIINKTLGAPDIIVDNAVIQYTWKTVLEQDIEDFESQFRSCVLQNVHMAKAFIPAMVKKGCGRMIAINTTMSMLTEPKWGAYVAGKRGMDGLLRVLAKEVGSFGITVNQIAPGWTISDLDRDAGTEKQPEYDKNVPLCRRGTDQELANVVSFLASDLGSYITGAFIPVCGGIVMPAI